MPEHTPGPLERVAMTFDPMSERVLLMGYPEDSDQMYLQMWAWDGTD